MWLLLMVHFLSSITTILDPLTTLTYVAGVTERISLGTSVIDMFFQNPVVLAKRFTTLDVLSDGRAIAGLGIGWSKDEYEVSGIPYKERGTRADEYIQSLKKIWTDDIVEFKGQFYNIPASKIGPKPIQKTPSPDITRRIQSKDIFADSKLCKRMDRSCWFGPLEQLDQLINGLREGARKADKDPSKISIYIGSYPNIRESPPSSNQTRTPMTGA